MEGGEKSACCLLTQILKQGVSKQTWKTEQMHLLFLFFFPSFPLLARLVWGGATAPPRPPFFSEPVDKSPSSGARQRGGQSGGGRGWVGLLARLRLHSFDRRSPHPNKQCLIPCQLQSRFTPVSPSRLIQSVCDVHYSSGKLKLTSVPAFHNVIRLAA